MFWPGKLMPACTPATCVAKTFRRRSYVVQFNTVFGDPFYVRARSVTTSMCWSVCLCIFESMWVFLCLHTRVSAAYLCMFVRICVFESSLCVRVYVYVWTRSTVLHRSAFLRPSPSHSISWRNLQNGFFPKTMTVKMRMLYIYIYRVEKLIRSDGMNIVLSSSLHYPPQRCSRETCEFHTPPHLAFWVSKHNTFRHLTSPSCPSVVT